MQNPPKTTTKNCRNNDIRPVNADDDEDVGGEVVAQSPDHHQDPAAQVVQHPLHRQPPAGFQWHRDEGHQRVRDCEVEHENVDIGTAPTGKKGGKYVSI